MDDLAVRAARLSATEITKSWRKGKKLAVLYRGSWIHFGAAGMSDFTIHKDKERRARYRKRHRGILLGDGRPAYRVKTSPAYWAWHLLW